MRTWLWWRNLKEGDHLENLGADKKIILKWTFKKWNETWTRLMWLSIGTGAGRL
jgi:hypothetical protein